MRLVLQRVKSGRVTVAGQVIAQIDRGVVILLGIGREDQDPGAAAEKLQHLADKTANLRIFEDEAGKINLSLLDVGGEAIVVSQFTLYADTRKGRRPSFTDAALPETARPLVDQFVAALAAWGVPTQTGIFGEHMLVDIANDGPVTILLER